MTMWKIFKSNVVFLLLQTFEKMAKINTIKTILMNSSNVLLKNSDKFKNIIAVSTGKFLKLRYSSFTVIWTKLLSSKLLNYHILNLKLLKS